MGQRSIASTFLFRASTGSSDCKEKLEIKTPSQKGSRLSLSDFLNRKLHRSSVLPSSVPGKRQPFSSPLRGENLGRGAQEETIKKEGREVETSFSIDDAFRMFKNVEKGTNDSKSSCSTNATVISDIDDLQQTRKRKTLFEGHDCKLPAKKRLVVLGEDSKLKRGSTGKKIGDKTPPLFNHYTDGGGWWDDNMVGVDNEEIGCSEVWEGVGFTTLGGIEWD